MPLRIYTNHNVFGQIVRGLRRQGVDVLTAYEDGAHELDDVALLHRAARLERVLFSQDDDFLAVTARWLRDGKEFPGLVYVHQRRLAIGTVIENLELLAKASEPEDLQNQVVYLPL